MARPAGTTAPASAAYRDHHIVCGLNGLGLRLAEHLHALGQQVVVVPGDTTRAYRAALGSLGIPIVEGSHDDEFALVEAGVEHAKALALVADDDIGNLRAALHAAKHSSEQRIVLRLFNEDLGERIKTLFEDCVILSQSAIAAPFFAAAALGEVDGERVALAGRALLVRRTGPDAEPPRDLLLALANVRDGEAELFPEHAEAGGEVLVDLGPFENVPAGRLELPAHRHRSLKDRWWAATATLRQLIDVRLRLVVLVMIAVLAGGTVYFSLAKGLNVISALYFSVVTLSTVGYGDINLQNDPTHVKIVGIGFIMLGATVIAIFFAILTDTIVGVRLAQVLGGVRGRMRDHVIVCGLGNVGFRVVERLAEHDVPVVAIESDDDCRHLAGVRRLGVPVVIGDATLTDTLHAAQVETAQALVTTSDSDVADLEAAINARALHPHLRIILRLFDHDLSTAVERRFDIHISRSTAVLAAPVFATEMLGHEFITSIDVAGTAVAFAEVEVAAGAPTAGHSVSELHSSTEMRVLAVQSDPGAEPDWDVKRERVLAAGERIAIVGRAAVVQELAGGPA
jgi:Trk K+ transport system NAD-binding subunit